MYMYEPGKSVKAVGCIVLLVIVITSHNECTV